MGPTAAVLLSTVNNLLEILAESPADQQWYVWM